MVLESKILCQTMVENSQHFQGIFLGVSGIGKISFMNRCVTTKYDLFCHADVPSTR